MMDETTGHPFEWRRTGCWESDILIERRKPIGLLPFSVWKTTDKALTFQGLLNRRDALVAAIARYKAEGFEPDPLWLEELNGFD